MESNCKLYVYFHLFLFFTSLAQAQAADPQTESLLTLKSKLTDNSNTLQDWSINNNNSDNKQLACCSWSGIRCNQNSTSIISINLSSKSLSGNIPGNLLSVFTDLLELNISDNSFSGEFPPEIFNITSLRSLDISLNNFSGPFPNGVSSLKNLIILDALSNSFSGSLPIGLTLLENLKVLNLAGSYFTGSIPSQYGSFKNLEFLHLGGNLLSGNIPKELGNLKTLTHMEIGYNSYQGVIPWQIGYMSELKYLDIAGANLSGFLPKHFSNLTKLESLFLFRNHLSGEIPWEFGNITSLVNLDLSDNHLSGTIPESLVGLKNLKLLSLMYNEMSGTLPEVIAQLPSLDTLFIWNNYFSGSLPKSLGMNSKLRWVDVSTNSFQGEIPQGICSRGVLYKLMLFSNNFTGSLSPSLSNCSTLVRIRLEDNSFSGVIPFSFSQLPDISYIDLSRNKLTGGIPQDISKATKLDYFNISHNPELGGRLPLEIWSLPPRLCNFSASSCSISGPLPEFDSCKSITVIELSNNNISGTITPSVSSCRSLYKMDLAGNIIAGGVPETLAKLPHLRVLDLSDNNLSGSIPSDKVFRSMGRNAYEGNANLCGLPLKSCAAYSSRRLVSVLVACLVSFVIIVAGTLGLYYVHHRSQSRWKMVSFSGLPHFTADDVLRSFGSPEPSEEPPQVSASVCKAVLPTGITVIVRKIELQGKKKSVMLKVLTQMGNARHVNLVRLLGFCYNNHLVYVLYDNNLHTGTLAEKMRTKKRDWVTKKRIISGVAKGLCFLHHECYPAIPHGDVRSSNVLFNDDNMEPCLGEFGFKYMLHLNKGLVSSDQMNYVLRAEQQKDIYNFGELVLEILTNGKLRDAGRVVHNKPKDVLLREVYAENEVSSNGFDQGEVKRVVEVAFLCISSNQSDRPCMEEVLRFLSEAPSSRLK